MSGLDWEYLYGELLQSTADQKGMIDYLEERRAALEAENERLRDVVDAAREGCDTCHKYNGSDYCCDCYHAGSGTHDALAALEEEVGDA